MRSVLIGAVTGWILARSGLASSEDVLHSLLFVDPSAALVALGALVAALLIGPAHRGPTWPALLFGVGVGVTGALPVTTFVQVGEGRLAAVALLAGVGVGAWLGRTRQDEDYSRDK